MTEDKIEAATNAIQTKVEAIKKFDALWRDNDGYFRLAVLLGTKDPSTELSGLIALAENGDADADHLLLRIGAGLIERGEIVPLEMRKLITDVLRSDKARRKGKPGPNRYNSTMPFACDEFVGWILHARFHGSEPTIEAGGGFELPIACNWGSHR